MHNTINAAVPGAYYGDLAYQQFKQGNYGAAAAYEAAGLGDAALVLLPFGAAVRSEITGLRAARISVPSTVEVAGPNVTYKLETYLLDPDHKDGGA